MALAAQATTGEAGEAGEAGESPWLETCLSSATFWEVRG